MFFSSRIKSVDFSVFDISCYKDDLDSSVRAAEDGFRKLTDLAREILDSLSELAQKGEENLNACLDQIALCAAEKEVVESKLRVLEGLPSPVPDSIRRSVEEDITSLRGIKGGLAEIDYHLQNQRYSLEQAANKMQDICEKLNKCIKNLELAYSVHVNDGLCPCLFATEKALDRAKYANHCMSELNDVSYSSGERICVTDIAYLRNCASELAQTLDRSFSVFRDMRAVCGEYREIQQDNIIGEGSEAVIDLTHENEDAFYYLSTKAQKLQLFSQALEEYYETKM